MLEKCHFIGIGGIGMSGLALILLKKNSVVSGSDISDNATTKRLTQEGAHVHIGHSSSHIAKDLTVVYSTDIKESNPEYQAALHLKCKMLHRSDLLKLLMEGKKSLAVTGTHGKTTTTSLLTTVLKYGNANPSFAVGGVIPQFGSNAEHGEGEFFVAEADESDGTFTKYKPFGAIVTNIGLDHLNHFKSEGTLIREFEVFLAGVQSKKHLFWCGDDVRLQKIAKEGVSYGFTEKCDLRISQFHQEGWSSFFDIDFEGKHYARIEVPLLGRHNALNASAVFGLALKLGISESLIRKGLLAFQGVCRRAEKKGEHQSVLLLDDYAHYPTEIAATLKGVRGAIGERRLIVVFQPHRYTRTRDCLGLYGNIFHDADELFVTDIYAGSETPIPGVTIEKVIEDIKRPSKYIPRDKLGEELAKFIRPHDVVITLGAGDITHLGNQLLEILKRDGVTKYRVGVVFGGRSSEHEVSIISSRYMIDSLNRNYYDVYEFGINKHGKWFLGEINEDDTTSLPISSKVMDRIMECDVFIPILHGNFGEDGTIQGFFEMLDKPYAGPDHRACAIAMDKALLKAVWLHHGIRTSPYVVFTAYEWNNDRDSILKSIREKLRYPLYAKGPHLGSSISVTRVEKEEELPAAVDEVLKFDSQILVENEVIGREIEFAVLGNDRVTVLPPGEVIRSGEIYTYDEKYTDSGIPSIFKAELTSEELQKGIEWVKKAYQLAGCKGCSRVDVFLDASGNYWMSEINPLPGCTPFSMFPKVCEINGFPGPELVDRLVILALEKKRTQAKFSHV
jgi:UDP-N-acetylmuramate--alanine ligase